MSESDVNTATAAEPYGPQAPLCCQRMKHLPDRRGSASRQIMPATQRMAFLFYRNSHTRGAILIATPLWAGSTLSSRPESNPPALIDQTLKQRQIWCDFPMKKIDTRYRHPEGHNVIHRRVIQLRQQSGMSCAEPAQIAGAHEMTARKWLQKARQEGDGSLLPAREARWDCLAGYGAAVALNHGYREGDAPGQVFASKSGGV